MGYSTKKILSEGKTELNVTMLPSLENLEEIVVIGYGTQRKIDVTGAIYSIKVADIKTIPVPTIAQSMMGRTSGVFVKIKNAQPGDYSGISFNIRGFGDALLIIDGLPATNEEFLLLDPNDIDEFNVLKDASAAAVYGAKAGTGVILIKT